MTDLTPQQIAATSLLVAVQFYGQEISTLTFRSLVALKQFCVGNKLPLSVALEPKASLVPISRSRMIGWFIDRPKASHLLLVNADIGFRPVDVVRLLNHDVEVVAAAFPLRPESRGLAWTPAGENDGDLIEGLEVAAGFMMLNREILPRLRQAYPVLSDVSLGGNGGPSAAAYFDPALEDGRYVSGDRMFCRRWRAIGGKVLVDTKIRLLRTGLGMAEDDLPGTDGCSP